MFMGFHVVSLVKLGQFGGLSFSNKWNLELSFKYLIILYFLLNI